MHFELHSNSCNQKVFIDLPNQPEKYLFDVRDPPELAETGQIPTSINIPLADLEESLKLSQSDFKAKFGRDKPSYENEVIFHCKMGGRAGRAILLAESLGFKNSKSYKGLGLNGQRRKVSQNNFIDVLVR